MKKSIKIITLSLAVFTISFLSMGCNKEKPEERTKIVLMNGWGGVTEDHLAMQEIYKEFEMENPDIDLVLDTSPDLSIVLDKANDMLTVGKMPNIISTNGYGDFVRNAVKKGFALDLMPYIEADDKFRKCISEDVYKNWEVDGKLYTIPDAVEMSGYWYNKAIFKAAGVEAVPATWDQYWETCEKIKQWNLKNNRGIVPAVIENNQASLSFLGARIAGENEAGTLFMQSVPTTFKTPEIKTAMEDLAKMYEYVNNPYSLTVNDALDAFNKGKAAMYINGVWANTFLKEDMDIGLANYPGYDGKRVAYTSVSSGYVIGNTEGKDRIEASVRFLKYMLSDEVQLKILADTKQVPSNPNINTRTEDFSTSSPLLSEAIQTVNGASIKIRTIKTLWKKESVSAVQDNIDNFVKGKITVDDIIEKMEAGIK